MKLYGYWRSQATYRVRVALNFKGITPEDETIDLSKGVQFQPEYRALNPQSVVPALIDGPGPALTQSLAILAGDRRTGRFCQGDAPTMADICLAGQVIGAQNSDCDVKPYPTVLRIFDACMGLDAFSSAHPRQRPDAPKATVKS